MSRRKSVYRSIIVLLALGSLGAAWWGCSATPDEQTSSGGGTVETTSSGTGGAGATGGVGGFDGGAGDGGDGGACVSISKATEPVKLDMIFLVDRSQSMAGEKWDGTIGALTQFFYDPASAKIGAGLVYVPTGAGCECDFTSYQALDVPISSLPDNAFALTNSMPANATGACTPTYGGLKGALTAATAYQDAHPTHTVTLVFAADGEAWTPFGCDPVTIDTIADLAKGALNYNGVRTYVIGVDGALDNNLDKIAEAGGTTAAYDVTLDVSEFAATIAEIRKSALGCEFEIPPPPSGEDEIDPDKVNFSYTPGGVGMPKVLLRAIDLADCGNDPGWYFDSNTAPTKIILCPASCTTVQADGKAKVDVLFGCNSLLK